MTVTLSGPVVCLLLILAIVIVWGLVLRFLLRKLDEFVIPRIEKRYKVDPPEDEESS